MPLFKNMGKFLEDIAPAIPIVGGIASNILEGMNTRKARLYDSPANQIKRMREAGLPMAAGSNITGGGGFTTKTAPLGTENYTSNIGQSIVRATQRQQLKLMQEELKIKGAEAALAMGNAKNVLNPAGTYEPTNQGTSLRNTIAAQEQAIENQKIVNSFLPAEKALGLQKGNAELKNLIQDLTNKRIQEGILGSERQIKSILAQYQERMSAGELTNLIRRNTGLKWDNKIKEIAFDIDYATQFAKITEARNRAMISGQQLKALELSNTLAGMQTESAKQWYRMKSRVDQRFEAQKDKWYYNMTGQDLMYLGMFSPNNTTNFGSISNLLSIIPK